MATNWQLSGDYFENCNCNVVCPCLISPAPPLTSRPTQGVCDVALAFHIDNGSYGAVALGGLSLALIAHTPGPMAEGNWTVAIYVDERSSDQQAEALGAIFGGAEGGPMAAFAPMIATNLGVKKVPITYRVTGKTRSAEIPGIMHMAVQPLPTLRADGEMWASAGPLPASGARENCASGYDNRSGRARSSRSLYPGTAAAHPGRFDAHGRPCDNRFAAPLARLSAGRPLPRRSAILVLGAAPGTRLL